jgi:pimeloyl-ACP methyl ester carboxylesterase
MDGILFPSGPSTYQFDSFKSLMWIPKDGKIDGRTDVGDDAIPCILEQYKGSPLWMIYAHGNGCDIGEMARDMRIYSKAFQANVICFEYPGYGISGGSPSSDGCIAHLKITYKFLTNYLKVPNKNIILFGRSIGSGITSALSLKIEKKSPGSLGGIILQSPYINIREMAKVLVGWIGWLSPNPLDNLSAISHAKCPVLLIHGEQDNLIPSSHSEYLFKHCTSPNKSLKLCKNADHNSWNDDEDVLDPIIEFLVNVHRDSDKNAPVVPIPDLLSNPPKQFSGGGSAKSNGGFAPFEMSKSLVRGSVVATTASIEWSVNLVSGTDDQTEQ